MNATLNTAWVALSLAQVTLAPEIAVLPTVPVSAPGEEKAKSEFAML